MMGFGGFGMMFGMVIFWVLVVGLALWLLSRLFPGTGQRPPNGQASVRDTTVNGSRRALEILNERYARGDITRAEYQEIRRDLEG
jgi:putative membrane protein